MKTAAKYYSLFTLIICSWVYSWGFYERFPYVNGDEPFYARGHYKHAPDWGPIYHLYYHILNNITESSFISVYYNHVILTFILIPLVTFVTLRNLKFSIESSSAAGLIALLSHWNYPSDSRVQIFNYIILLLAFNIRWILKKEWHFRKLHINLGHFFFYIILALSLYIRQDNIIILAITILWDTWHTSHKSSMLVHILSCLTIYFIGKDFFGNTYSNPRTVEIFLDHLYFSNRDLYSNFTKAQIPSRVFMNIHYKNPSNLWEIITNQPSYFFLHIWRNIVALPSEIGLIFSLKLGTQWNYPLIPKLIFIVLFFSTLPESNSYSEQKRDSFLWKEIQLISLALTIKCLFITILLSWWIKYYTELQIIAIIWAAIILHAIKYSEPFKAKIAKQWSLFVGHLSSILVFIMKHVILQKRKVNQFFNRVKAEKIMTSPFRELFEDLSVSKFMWLCLPLVFLLYIYDNTDPNQDKNFHKIYEALLREHSYRPIKIVISNDEIYMHPKAKYTNINLWVDRQYDHQIKSNMKKFLKDANVDTILMHPRLRYSLKEVGLQNAFKHFEENYDQYGYQVVFASPNDQVIYRPVDSRRNEL